jgi:glycosyltransferase involved in cell wall biosynthesis
MAPSASTFLARIVNIGGVTGIVAAIAITYAIRTIRTPLRRLRAGVDVIVTSSHYPPDVLAATLLRMRNPAAKLVVYVHGKFPEVPPHHGTVLRVLSLVYNYLGAILAIQSADLIFVFNKYTRDRIVAMGAKYNRVVLSSNAPYTHSAGETPERNMYEACFLGRLVQSKGIHDLVRVWRKVQEHKRGAKLLVIGSGPTESVLEFARAEGVSEGLVLTGYVSEERKLNLLKSTRVFLFPSYSEGWGIAIAEALSCGLPVVAYDLSIYREIFEDQLITVPTGDVQAMAERIIFLLNHPETAKKRGEQGREFVKKYDWRTIASSELGAIQAILETRVSPQGRNLPLTSVEDDAR